MKIEIELSDLEEIKARMNEYQSENVDLKMRLEKLNESNLEMNADRKAIMLANDFLTDIFAKLGFDQTNEYLTLSIHPAIGYNWLNNVADVEFLRRVRNDVQSISIRITTLK